MEEKSLCQENGYSDAQTAVITGIFQKGPADPNVVRVVKAGIFIVPIFESGDMDRVLAGMVVIAGDTEEKANNHGELQMKIAVASNDGTNISRHFGRSNYFIIFDFDGETSSKKEIRTNPMSHLHKKNREHHHTNNHDHNDIIETLSGCTAVIAHGMGKRASDDLQMNNIQPCLIDRDYTPYEAALEFYQGKLEISGSACHCQH